MRMRICAGWSELTQITDAIRIKISCTGPYDVFLYSVAQISHFFITEIYSAVLLFGIHRKFTLLYVNNVIKGQFYNGIMGK